MKNILKCVGYGVAALVFPVSTAQAQCRIGSGPPQGDGIPYCSQLQAPVRAPRAPQWASRWGAIAYGGGGFGASTNMSSPSKANRAALRACKDSGGSGCTVHVSYHDQCAAYAVGDAYFAGIARSPFSQEAQAMAIEVCSQSTTNCRVTYSACSLPERVR